MKCPEKFFIQLFGAFQNLVVFLLCITLKKYDFMNRVIKNMLLRVSTLTTHLQQHDVTQFCQSRYRTVLVN